MARIIGQEPKHLRECSCRKCASKVEYSLNEVQSYSYKDISQCTETIYWIHCPGCGNKIEGVKHY